MKVKKGKITYFITIEKDLFSNCRGRGCVFGIKCDKAFKKQGFL